MRAARNEPAHCGTFAATRHSSQSVSKLAQVETGSPAKDHFARKHPGWFTTHVFNRIVAGLTGLGISVFGSRVLEVPGRSSGVPRRTPVNLLTFEHERYLVAPRGETQWARNLRASGQGRLLVGKRSESFTAVELADSEKPPVLRAYLKRWKFEVGVFFDGVGPDSPDQELLGAASKHPVFRLRSSAG
jgi:deazaflavin-dependent oxidoreductase (nitroreductase family)